MNLDDIYISTWSLHAQLSSDSPNTVKVVAGNKRYYIYICEVNELYNSYNFLSGN